MPGKRGHFRDVHFKTSDHGYESVAEAEKENCMSEVFATFFLFLMCCLKLKGRRDIRTGRESTGIENYGSSSVSEKQTNKTKHKMKKQHHTEDIVKIRVGI